MFRTMKRAWNNYRERQERERRARLRDFINEVTRDCYDPARQAERLARWGSLLNNNL